MAECAGAADVLVLGAGVAGLSAALAASRAGARVKVIGRGAPEDSHSTRALGGMNAVLGDESHPLDHARDTVAAGDYLADQDAVESMCRDAGPTVERLLELGLPLNRERLGRSGHWPYTLPDVTGATIVAALHSAVRAEPRAELAQGRATALLLAGEACAGAELERAPGALDRLNAGAVVLATGGFGHLWRPTVTATEATGDGVALAYCAGAELMDLEFVQYHPTSLAGTSVLVSERARGAGARLVNARGERFMERYAPGALELAPRDVVTRAIVAEVAAGRGASGAALLDFSGVSPERWPAIEFVREELLRAGGPDPRREPVPVGPSVHYTMGGVRTDGEGRTTVAGLLAAGEVACVSAHGANRLGGNSLLEAAVFGWRAGAAAAADAGRAPARVADGALAAAGCLDARPPSPALGALMHAHAGPVRDGPGLEEGLSQVAAMRRRDGRDASLELAQAVLACALAREESRGAHYRHDRLARDDERWLAHSVVRRGPGGEPQLGRRPATITRWPPAERRYGRPFEPALTSSTP